MRIVLMGWLAWIQLPGDRITRSFFPSCLLLSTRVYTINVAGQQLNKQMPRLYVRYVGMRISSPQHSMYAYVYKRTI